MAFRSAHLSHRSQSRILLVGSLALLPLACHSRAVAPSVLAKAPSEMEELPALEGESGPVVKREVPRRVGDTWVHRFSGTYRSGELILREHIIAQKGDLLVVDFILEEGDSTTHLRVEMAQGSERIVRVARILDDEVHVASVDDFNQMLQKTTFVPDQNKGRIAQKVQTCLVGKSALDCELSAYKVRLGDQEATLTVARNDEIQRDISGEITAVDGTVLYHAELIEMQRGQPAEGEGHEGVARADLANHD